MTRPIISIRIDPSVERRVKRMAAEFTRAQREIPNRKIASAMHSRVMRNFRNEEGEGAPWAPLAPRTIRWKQKRGYSKILQNTGLLRASFAWSSTPDRASVFAQPIHGAPDKRPPNIALFHQEGGKFLPRRPMLPSRAQALDIAIKVYNLEIEAKRRKVRL